MNLHIKKKALWVVSAIVLALAVFFFFQGVLQHDKEIALAVNEEQRIIDITLEDITRFAFTNYHIRTMQLAESSPKITQAFYDRNRPMLLKEALPVYKNLREENINIHAFDFVLPDGTVFLRLQRPEYGDNISGARSIINAVNEDKKQHAGYDVGKHGIMYWIAQPIMHNGKYAGIMELGITLDQLLSIMKKRFNAELTTLIKTTEWNKATLAKEKVRMAGQYVLMADNNSPYAHMPEDLLKVDDNTRTELDGKAYILHSCVILKGHKGDTLGKILMLQNITDKIDRKKAFIRNSIIVTFILLLLSFGILYSSFDKLIGRLENYTVESAQAKEIIESLQRATFNNIPDIAWFKNEQGKYIAVNRHFSLICKTDLNSVMGKSDLDLWPEALALKFIADDREVMNSSKRKKVEEQMLDREGNCMWVETVKAPIFKENGDVIGTIGIARNITERKLMEERLRKSEANLAEAQRIAKLGSWEWDIASRQTSLSEEACRIFGKTIEFSPAMFEQIFQLIHPDDRTHVKEVMDEALALKKSYSIEYRIVSSYGDTRIVHEKSEVLSNTGSFSVRIIGTIQDITEDREKELRLIVTDRLASLGEMAAGIAHEINNPLATIASCAEGLSSRIRDQKYEPELFSNYLKIIGDEIFRCKRITTAMLSFVRHSSGMNNEFDIHILLDKCLEMFSIQNRLEGMTVVKDLSATRLSATGNEEELMQAFTTIISNALEAMGNSGRLTIATSSKTTDGTGKAIIRISDTGCGIPAQYINRIFEPFFSTKTSSGGTGLGLAIARRIIMNHNGSIEATSEIDKGTVITVTLPERPATDATGDGVQLNQSCIQL